MLSAHSLGVLTGGLLCAAAAAYGEGFYGQTVQGVLESSPAYAVYNLQNFSNQGSPQAIVTSGPEFSADFEDSFLQPWHLTADFGDDYSLVVHSGGAPNQIGTGQWFVRWHFSNFQFPIADVQWAPEPDPIWRKANLSFDSGNIWISFFGLYPWPPYDTYTFQITPAPEPASAALLAMGGCAVLLGRRRRARAV